MGEWILARWCNFWTDDGQVGGVRLLKATVVIAMRTILVGSHLKAEEEL